LIETTKPSLSAKDLARAKPVWREKYVADYLREFAPDYTPKPSIEEIALTKVFGAKDPTKFEKAGVYITEGIAKEGKIGRTPITVGARAGKGVAFTDALKKVKVKPKADVPFLPGGTVALKKGMPEVKLDFYWRFGKKGLEKKWYFKVGKKALSETKLKRALMVGDEGFIQKYVLGFEEERFAGLSKTVFGAKAKELKPTAKGIKLKKPAKLLGRERAYILGVSEKAKDVGKPFGRRYRGAPKTPFTIQETKDVGRALGVTTKQTTKAIESLVGKEAKKGLPTISKTKAVGVAVGIALAKPSAVAKEKPALAKKEKAAFGFQAQPIDLFAETERTRAGVVAGIKGLHKSLDRMAGKVATKTVTRPAEKLGVGALTTPIHITLPTERIGQKTGFALRIGRLTKPVTKPAYKPPVTITTTPSVPKTPGAPFLWLPGFPGFKPPKAKPKEEQGYDAFVRSRGKKVKGKWRKGEFFKANPFPLLRENALSLGSRIVEHSAAATFKVKEAEKPVKKNQGSGKAS